jgi:hypothetical protein
LTFKRLGSAKLKNTQNSQTSAFLVNFLEEKKFLTQYTKKVIQLLKLNIIPPDTQLSEQKNRIGFYETIRLPHQTQLPSATLRNPSYLPAT